MVSIVLLDTAAMFCEVELQIFSFVGFAGLHSCGSSGAKGIFMTTQFLLHSLACKC